MNLKSPEEYLRNLNQIPAQAKQILHTMRKLDQQVLVLHNDIQSKREKVLERVAQYEVRKSEKSKSEIEQTLKTINAIHKRMLKLTRNKKQLAERLYNCIDKPTQELERDLSKIIPEPVKEFKNRKNKKDAAQEYLVSEPSYCYCKRPSFGKMVKCGSEKCDTQWFHMDCVSENGNEIQGDWYCKDCRKDREKRRIR